MDNLIDRIDVLKSFLARAYWFEIKMEQTKEWLGFLNAQSEECKEALFQITRDSDNHKNVLEQLFLDIDDFNVKKTIIELNLNQEETIYNNKLDEEIFNDIYQTEKKAFEIYTLIKEKTDKNLIDKIWNKASSKDFFDTIDWLISEEKKHMNLVEPFSHGIIQRIQ